jgi:hypothetical protein
MSSPNEPPHHVDMKKWSDTWDRIRTKQAEERAEAAAAELRDSEPDSRVDDPPAEKTL